MPEDYDDSDLNEEERFIQRTIMMNLISSGGQKPMRIRRSTYEKLQYNDEF